MTSWLEADQTTESRRKFGAMCEHFRLPDGEREPLWALFERLGLPIDDGVAVILAMSGILSRAMTETARAAALVATGTEAITGAITDIKVAAAQFEFATTEVETLTAAFVTGFKTLSSEVATGMRKDGAAVAETMAERIATAMKASTKPILVEAYRTGLAPTLCADARRAVITAVRENPPVIDPVAITAAVREEARAAMSSRADELHRLAATAVASASVGAAAAFLHVARYSDGADKLMTPLLIDTGIVATAVMAMVMAAPYFWRRFFG